MMMQMLALLTIIICIGVPLAFAWRVCRTRFETRTAWLIAVGEMLAFSAFIFIVGRWDVAGIHVRNLLAIALLAAILFSATRLADRPWRAEGPVSDWRAHWSRILSGAAFAIASFYIGAGLFIRDDPQAFAFPLRDGSFLVGQGGSRLLLNHHFSHRTQRHAADIVGLNAAGFRAAGLHPAEAERYAIWNAQVVSPCAGRVVEVRDGLADMVPPRMDPDQAAGNHLILECTGTRIELAHFRNGSLLVAPGDRVEIGDPLGRVGNSGNSSEPHLHVHAMDAATGRPVQMTFDGRLPVRNQIFRR